MRRSLRYVLVLICLGLAWASGVGPAARRAGALTTWLRPVSGPVVRPFRAPLTRYGAGHLGADLAAVPGSEVRAAGEGTVVFAGVVAGSRHVVLSHPGNLRTSYSFLAVILVRTGQHLARGTVLGTTGGRGAAHDGDVLHLGLRIGDAYADPMQLFAPPDLGAIVHLAPLSGRAGPTPSLRGRRAGRIGGPPLAPVAVGASAPRSGVTPPPALPRLVGPVGFDLVGAGRRSPSGARMFPR